MINFSSPKWFEEGELKMACFTITDTLGGQYVYRNRGRHWVENYLENLAHDGIYVIHYCGGYPDSIHSIHGKFISDRARVTIRDIAVWWEQARIFPPDAGCCFTFTSTDRSAHFMCYGYDRTPERAWIANPLAISLNYGRVPHKSRKQRKQELRDGKRKDRLIKSQKFDLKIKEHFPSYIHGKSLYRARCFTE